MANIVILVDSEAGHILSTNKLALRLKTRDHRVCYAGFAGAGSLVRRQGYEFFSILEGISGEERGTPHFGPLIRGEALDELFSKLKPDVVLINSLFTLEGLAVKYRYHIPTVLLRSNFSTAHREHRSKMVADRLKAIENVKEDFLDVVSRSGTRIDSIEEVSDLAYKLPELVFLPKGFDSPDEDRCPHLYYVGPAVDIDRHEEEFNWDKFDSRPIVYASLGSQSHLRPELSARCHQILIRAFSTMPEYKLILSVGRAGRIEDFVSVPDNIFIKPSVPQITVLKRSALMINHSGIGSVKECIMLGVPMVLFPLMRDQFICAQRVSEQGLGRVATLSEMMEQEVVDLIRMTIADLDTKARVQEMREIFNRADNLDLGISIIEGAAKNGC